MFLCGFFILMFCSLRNLYTGEFYYLALIFSFLAYHISSLFGFGGFQKNLIHECLFYFITSSCTHILVDTFWTKVCLNKLIITYLYHLQNIFFGSLWFLCFLSWCRSYIMLLHFWVLDMVWIPPIIHPWISSPNYTHFMSCAHLGEVLILCWLSTFFAHFGNCWQWGRSLEGLREILLSLRLVCS